MRRSATLDPAAILVGLSPESARPTADDPTTAAILDAAGSKAPRVKVGEPRQPLAFAPLRLVDRLLYWIGLPALGTWQVAEGGRLWRRSTSVSDRSPRR